MILLQAWFKFFAIKHDQPEDSNELFQKLFEDLKELAEYKKSLENSSKEFDVSNSNQEKEEPPRDSDIQPVEICRQKELLCMHDNVDDLIESALDSKLLSINSQRLEKEQQEVQNVIEQPAERRTLAPILSTKEPEYSPSMGYEHSNTTSEIELDEIIKSGIEELVPILNENEVTLEDKRECDLPVCENSPICEDHSEIFSDSKDDDGISSDDDDFEDNEYVEASLPDPEIEVIDLEDISQIQDFVLRKKLMSINRFIANIESLNDNPTLDLVLTSFVSIPISEESDNSLSDNFSPEFKTFCDHTEETRSGNTTTHANDSLPEGHPFLEELLINYSIPFSNNESSDFNFEDNPSFPRPPPEPPDFETDTREEISVVMNDKDKFDDTLLSCLLRCFLFSLLRVRILSLTL
nr:hypothetical protein [Tanacetum cinerariifolium]